MLSVVCLNKREKDKKQSLPFESWAQLSQVSRVEVLEFLQESGEGLLPSSLHRTYQNSWVVCVDTDVIKENVERE